MPTPRALAAVRRALAATLLPPSRTILMLHFADDLTPAEIGGVLGMPETEILREIANLKTLAKAGLAVWQIC